MPSIFSNYLDVIRFLAAFIVFIGHASGMYWTGGFLWQIGAYGDTCVVIFFVLSGFVIAYVAENKESGWQTYAASRISRLWSVAIPALVLTFVIDYAGVRIAPELYIGKPWYAEDNPTLRYIASFFMLQEVWHLKLVPGINAPFWSLSFEAFYYLIFGLAIYVKSYWKWPAIFLWFLVGGPLIAILFPIWALGVLAYKNTRQLTLSKSSSYALFFFGLLIIIASPLLRPLTSTTFHVLDDVVVGRWVDAGGIYLHLLGAYGLSSYMDPLPKKLQARIAQVAATTFCLYLFHRPLIQFFSFVGPEDANSWLRRLLVIGGTLIITMLLYPLTEKLRLILRNFSLDKLPYRVKEVKL
ncbi:acyltransferase|uniref:acyltransferase family protein n=1 Tax=Noviherbaspirillum sp. L7-7A TaxID=2850560 RepID=UPI001C2C4851|nr:acyltransferase [Noviherbaspirillum sp. L7-7A]MBV0879074.1 acyltransferase [Noviherbaspirillum sp. L7-7A]